MQKRPLSKGPLQLPSAGTDALARHRWPLGLALGLPRPLGLSLGGETGALSLLSRSCRAELESSSPRSGRTECLGSSSAEVTVISGLGARAGKKEISWAGGEVQSPLGRSLKLRDSGISPRLPSRFQRCHQVDLTVDKEANHYDFGNKGCHLALFISRQNVRQLK